MNKYTCSTCGGTSYSAARLEHLVNKDCPYCGGAVTSDSNQQTEHKKELPASDN